MAKSVKLLEIAPREALPAVTVAVQGNEVEVTRLSAKRIAGIVARYPEVGMMFGEGDKPSAVRLIEIGASAIAAVIAAGCGYANDEAAEEFASELEVEDQLALVEAIARLSFPKAAPALIGQIRARVDAFLAALKETPAADPALIA